MPWLRLWRLLLLRRVHSDFHLSMLRLRLRLRLHLHLHVGRVLRLGRRLRLHQHLLMMDGHCLRNIVDPDKLMPKEVGRRPLADNGTAEDAVVLRRTRDAVTWIGAVNVAATACQVTRAAARFTRQFAYFGSAGDGLILVRLQRWRLRGVIVGLGRFSTMVYVLRGVGVCIDGAIVGAGRLYLSIRITRLASSNGAVGLRLIGKYLTQVLSALCCGCGGGRCDVPSSSEEAVALGTRGT